jgi:hypothetical protein
METHHTEKNTEKRQNFASSTPPACTEHLHFMLNGETKRAPRPPPDASAQMAWKGTDHKLMVD